MKTTPTNTPASSMGRTPLQQPEYLPMSRKEMQALGWEELDILIVTGDAYIDHPSFAAALLGRWLVAHGYRTGVVTQPRWDTTDDVTAMGRPLLFTCVTAGAIDSMLAHYTAFRKKRHDDAYTPGGKAGARPNRAIIAYTGLVRRAFSGLPVVIGGIEASLRRITHYDFWTDKLRKSILPDSKADVLVYGMGEAALLQLAIKAEEHQETYGTDGSVPFRESAIGIAGTAVMGKSDNAESDIRDRYPDAEIQILPSHEAIEADAAELMTATLALEKHVQHATNWAVQHVGNRAVIIAPPAPPLPQQAMDKLYSLPYSRRAHPAYTQQIPCESMMTTSITTHRGCGGGCSFCSLALHQGRRIASRSRTSILNEAERLAAMPDFKGSISDVGGPSANMWQAHCKASPERCKRASCMHPTVCRQFSVDQREAVNLLRTIAQIDRIKHVRVASGVRFDLAMKDEEALRAYTMEFTGGQLKVAPEHACDKVLDLMRKPGISMFEAFLEAFARYSDAAGKEQYVIPYLMSAFPGCTDNDMRRLGEWLASRGWKPQQVQCFIPTPGTVATAMFYAGIAPDGSPVYVARTDAQRLRQHHILMPERGQKPQRKASASKTGGGGKNRAHQKDNDSHTSQRKGKSYGRTKPKRR